VFIFSIGYFDPGNGAAGANLTTPLWYPQPSGYDDCRAHLPDAI
jgi:hypothetical protein